MSENTNTLVLYIDERRTAERLSTYYYNDTEYEGRQGGEGVAKMLAKQRGIDNIIMICAKDSDNEDNRASIDYNRFMEEFKKDYEQQIDMTAEQLKSIINTKNVNGKGDRLADAIKTVMSTRLEKSIERNRNNYCDTVTENCADRCRDSIVQYCNKNNLKKPNFITINIDASPDYDDAVSCASEVLDNLSTGQVFVDAEGGFDNSLLVCTTMMRVLKENGIEPELWGTRFDKQSRHEEIINQTQYFAQPREREAEEQFINYGKTEGLCDIFENSENTFINKVVECLVEFEENMQLSRPVQIKQSVKLIGDILCESKKLSNEDRPSDDFMQFIDELGRKFEPVADCDDTLKLVEWCLKNNYVHQAVVIFAELMPEYFFEHRIIFYDNFHDKKLNDLSYGDKVIEERRKSKSSSDLKYFWLNDMLWKSMMKKIFLNIDSPVTEKDCESVKRFKNIFSEVRHLQETKKNTVKTEDLSLELTGVLNDIAEELYISPVLNTLKKVCNYFFNYEVAGVAGSVQKSYKELSRMLITNRKFCEHFFGKEGERLVMFTPASMLVSKEQTDVMTDYDVWEVEGILRMYDTVRQQERIMNRVEDSGIKQMSLKEIKKYVSDAADAINFITNNR